MGAGRVNILLANVLIDQRFPNFYGYKTLKKLIACGGIPALSQLKKENIFLSDR